MSAVPARQQKWGHVQVHGQFDPLWFIQFCNMLYHTSIDAWSFYKGL